MKDLFSEVSGDYAKYRPAYPDELFYFLASIAPAHHCAWDCGTGNGQVASGLSRYFDKIYATDISQSQIDNAISSEKIIYSVQPAEQTNFEENSFDLIIVAQAIHWFDFNRFYDEVKRTGKQDAIICVLGYNRVNISFEIDLIITDFYANVIGKYWDAERKYIDEEYKTIPFPFNEFQVPHFQNVFQWSLEHFIGYVNTWSAVKHFIRQNGYNPVEHLQSTLQEYWTENETKLVNFPLLLRVGWIDRN